MSITRLVATYRLTTPMFCGGANAAAEAEFRPASFKGVLRFWYRALALGHYNGQWKDVRNAEAALFGSTTTGQSKVLISMKVDGPVKEIPKNTKVDGGFAYLAGQGLTKYVRDVQAVLTQRPAIAAGARFEVTCLFRKPTEHDLESVRKSLTTLGLLGGLGSRTRRAFGSLTLEKIEQTKDNVVEASWPMGNLDEALRTLFPKTAISSDTLEYTAFSSDSRFLLLPGNPGETAEQLLERVGRAFLHFRSYGRNGRAAGAQALQWFRRDHDEMLKFAKREVRHPRDVLAPARAVFGLPHNYFFSSMGKHEGTIEVHGASEQRRASPLFLHLHQHDQGPPTAILAFLPAMFLPSMELNIRNMKIPLPHPPELWRPIHEFFDELKQGYRSELVVKFPGAVEVKP